MAEIPTPVFPCCAGDSVTGCVTGRVPSMTDSNNGEVEDMVGDEEKGLQRAEEFSHRFIYLQP